MPLAGHGVVKPYAFSSSLLANLTGERAANKAVVRIQKMRRRAVVDQRRVEWHVALGLAPLGAAWLLASAAAAVASLS